MSKELIQKLNDAASKIASVSKKGPANYIITSSNISEVLNQQFRRTDRIMKIEKILKNYE